MQLARRAGIPLKIAAKVDNADREYYHPKINDRERLQEIKFTGEIGDREKGAFLGAAIALLFPADWLEPFHPMTTEAMTNGWPVIGFKRGAVPEAIDVGVTGF